MTAFRLAVVQSVDAAGVTVQFEGDSAPSKKKYPQLQSAGPMAGERVLMVAVSGSWILLGVVDRRKVVTT